MSKPLLSICIPTYNRSGFLDDCLKSLCSSVAGNLEQLEVVISDNASTDNTKEIVDKYRQLLPIQYFCNTENIGGERNFIVAATRGQADHVWVFGDDDAFEELGIRSALHYIQLGYDLIVLNYSLWSREMDIMLRPSASSFKHLKVYNNSNDAMASLGLKLGYISGMVVRKRIFIAAPVDEYQPFIEYGFSHLYSIYAGLLQGCRVIYLPDPAFKNRGDNSLIFQGEAGLSNWIKYFVYGTAFVFDSLERKGYSRWAVVGAKNQVLRDFVVRMLMTGIPGLDRKVLLDKMIHLYCWNWRFWVMCFPLLLIPTPILAFARRMFLNVRRHLWPVHYA